MANIVVKEIGKMMFMAELKVAAVVMAAASPAGEAAFAGYSAAAGLVQLADNLLF